MQRVDITEDARLLRRQQQEKQKGNATHVPELLTEDARNGERKRFAIWLSKTRSPLPTPGEYVLRLRKGYREWEDGSRNKSRSGPKGGDGDRSQGCSGPQVGQALKVKQVQYEDPRSRAHEAHVNSP